jgi:hypothetical protein
MVEVVVVAVDVADDGCDTVVDGCDVGCDLATEGGVSMEEMGGMGSESRWDGVGVGTAAFFGTSCSSVSCISSSLFAVPSFLASSSTCAFSNLIRLSSILLVVVAFFGHSVSNATEKWSHVSLHVAGKFLHQIYAKEFVLRCN